MEIKNNFKNSNIGVYARHSKEDENSQTITNQIGIISKYVKTRFGVISREYVDDGKSGVSLDRPSFNLLIDDIKFGVIDTVITKDLSRLARNYLEAGYIMENFFPKNNVRFIAINDNYDSNNLNDDGIAPIKNLFNEWYSRDISKKTISAKRNAAREGKFLGSRHPYGYCTSGLNKHKLIFDEKYSDNIKLIFNYFLKYKSARAVANKLNAKKILPPSARFKSEKLKINNGWSNGTILSILENEVYIGHMVNGKTKNFSYKDQRKVKVPQNEWIIVKNTHEPIISERRFEKVKRLRELSYNPRKRKSKINSIFTGLCFCDDCGSKMVLSRRKYKNEYKNFLRCSGYNQKGSSFCTPHNTSEEALLKNLREYCKKILKENQKNSLKIRKTGENNLNKQINKSISERKNYKSMIKKSETTLISTMEKSQDYPILNSILENFQEEITKYKNEVEKLEIDISKKNSVYKYMDEKTSSFMQFLYLASKENFAKLNFTKVFSRINVQQSVNTKIIKFTADFNFN